MIDAMTRCGRGTGALLSAALLVAVATTAGCSLTLRDGPEAPRASGGPASDSPTSDSPASDSPASGSPASGSPASGTATSDATVPPDPALARFYQQEPSWSRCQGTARGLDCAAVTVPLDWSQPAGTTITLALARHRASGVRQGTLLVNPGGPGASGIDFAAAATQVFSPEVTRSYDVIGWDPRGVGKSSPVRCRPPAGWASEVALDISPDTPAELAAVQQADRRDGAACLSAAGPLLSHVDTLSTARDLDVLRAVSGQTKLLFYGASYGTRIGAWYAETFPTRVGRMVLDSAVDPSLDAAAADLGTAEGLERALDAYLAGCPSRGSCPLARLSTKAARARIKALVDQADSRPMRTSGSRSAYQADVVIGIIGPLYDPADWPVLDRALAPALTGDGTGLLQIADQY
jgi:pimeloyl-ACP methyl ester carboxylesterase